MSFVLETDRLRLREWRNEDVDVLHRDLLGDPRVMVYSTGVLDPAGVEAWLAKNRDRLARDGHYAWAVERKSDGRIVGVCGLANQDLPEGRFPEIGYRFAFDVWGQGLASEAARGVLAWARRETSYGKIISIIDVANVRSVRVAEKMGMTFGWRTVFKGADVDVYAIDRDPR